MAKLQFFLNARQRSPGASLQPVGVGYDAIDHAATKFRRLQVAAEKVCFCHSEASFSPRNLSVYWT